MTPTQLLILAWFAPTVAVVAYVLMRAVETFEQATSGGVRFLAMFTAIMAVLALVLAAYSGYMAFDSLVELQRVFG